MTEAFVGPNRGLAVIRVYREDGCPALATSDEFRQAAGCIGCTFPACATGFRECYIEMSHLPAPHSPAVLPCNAHLTLAK